MKLLERVYGEGSTYATRCALDNWGGDGDVCLEMGVFIISMFEC